MNRRTALKLTLGAGLATTLALRGTPAMAKEGPFRLPPLAYAHDALEPHIDAATMRIHHAKHHAAYVEKLNELVADWPDLAKRPPVEIVANLKSVPEKLRSDVRNNLGGHWNHSFFWDLMTPGGATGPKGELLAAIERAFDSVDAMKQRVNDEGLKRFGAGWAWLAVDRGGKLSAFSTPNQDTPHMDMGARTVVLGVDVWEHAYYLKHQFRREDYLRAWWNTVNWDQAAKNFRTVAN